MKLNPRLAVVLFIRGQARIALAQTAEGNADQSAAQAISPNIAQEFAEHGIGPANAKAP